MDLSNWVKACTVENIFELDTVKDALDTEGIEYKVKEYKDTAYDGLFILQKGYAALYVREEDEDRAAGIVRRIKSLPYVAFSKD
jgi:hypothetical protein